MACPVDQLVNDDRFSGDNVSLFLLYIPLGLVLLCIRSLVGLVLWFASLILAEKTHARLLSTLACITFGIHVKQRGVRDPKCSLVVANYVSAMDPLAAYYMLGTLSLRKWKVPPFFASSLGIKNMAHFHAKSHLGEGGGRPLLVQPEGIPTSGRALAKFAHWPVPLADRVQPEAIKVERMFTKVTVHSGSDTTESVPWSDLLWYLCSPLTTYSLTLLPPLERISGETDQLFAQRIRDAIAQALEVESTDYEVSDVLACARRGVRHTPPRAQRPDLTRLAQQVKEVLPRVPTRDILRDLARTRSVDVTITNFLEEITPYTPEPLQDAQPSTSTAHASAPAPAPTPAPAAPPVSPLAASQFSTDPRLRQMSFQERKEKMIADARRKYIEKHGLKLDC